MVVFTLFENSNLQYIIVLQMQYLSENDASVNVKAYTYKVVIEKVIKNL